MPILYAPTVYGYSEDYYNEMSSANTAFNECIKQANGDKNLEFGCKSALIKSKTDAEYNECAKAYPETSSLGNKKCKETQEKDNSEQQSTLVDNACKEKYGTSCSDYAQKARNASGQGFKLPLDFLTLTTVDSSGKKVKQGSSIFANKDYATYGVLLGTFLRIIDILVYVIGSVALLTLIVAGIMMIANHGDEGWVTKGKGMMLYSILGVIFALLSFIFVNIITSLLS